MPRRKEAEAGDVGLAFLAVTGIYRCRLLKRSWCGINCVIDYYRLCILDSDSLRYVVNNTYSLLLCACVCGCMCVYVCDRAKPPKILAQAAPDSSCRYATLPEVHNPLRRPRNQHGSGDQRQHQGDATTAPTPTRLTLVLKSGP